MKLRLWHTNYWSKARQQASALCSNEEASTTGREVHIFAQ